MILIFLIFTLNIYVLLQYFSEVFKEYAESYGIKVSVINMKDCEPEEVLVEEVFCLFV